MPNSNDISKLLNRTGSIYKLVILASRRTIELSEGAAKLVETPVHMKPMNVAIEEIAEGKVTYKVNKE
ncbi:MAG: DNA-directed RNA polymerase subunit omega [Candidatus Omnitrophica bacterium]|nr:DNA-directed RNA polymerase subunit omega [Candidatus Omnitrophota bacterium]